MAKKKSPPAVPAQSEIGNEMHENVNDGFRYHATFTPTWRTEIDCGDYDSLEDAQSAIVEEGETQGVKVTLGWHRETPENWTATGHDGEVDTLLTIAKITRVQVAE